MATCISNSPDETVAFGRRFAENLKPGDVLALTGDLGSGKTQFVKGLAAGIGAATPATSPTFTLIHEYGPKVYHIDLYRLEEEREVETLGLEEIFEKDAVALIEWGERFPKLMPDGSLEIRLEQTAEDERRITCNF